jgi:hypothetical protein
MAVMAIENERLAATYPPQVVPPAGCNLHLYEDGGQWYLWVNSGDLAFDGLCIGVGATADEARREGVNTLLILRGELVRQLVG